MEQVTLDTTPVDQAEEDQKHDEEMVAKVDDTQEKILGKFDNVDALEKAYTELEKKLGSENDSKDPVEITKETSLEIETDEAQAVVEEAGLDFNSMMEEYTADGQLSDGSYTKLKEAGIPKEIVDQYIDGQVLKNEQTEAAVFEFAGGEEDYSNMVTWAKENLNENEIEFFNTTIASGNIDQIKMTVESVRARWSSNDEDGEVVGKSVVGNVDVFRSWPEVTEAMKDPRYAKDPAYRRDVEAKIGRSKNL